MSTAAVHPGGLPSENMPNTSSTTVRLDPTSLSPGQWGSKLAAFKSRGALDTDPRIVECHAALSFWRLKRQIDKEVGTGLLSPSFAAAIVEKLLEYPYLAAGGEQ